MDTERQPTQQMQRLAGMVRQASVAMLTTFEENGFLRSRPLVTLQMDSQGQLWFCTREHSPQAHEVARDSRVNLSFADPDKQDYVSITGTAALERDPRHLRALWTEDLRQWFPDGPETPGIVLLRVAVEEAEYWDAPEGRMQRLFGMARAIGTGQTEDLGDHGKVRPGEGMH
jgi:general stress protein 26